MGRRKSDSIGSRGLTAICAVSVGIQIIFVATYLLKSYGVN